MKQLTMGGMALPSALASASRAMVHRGSCCWTGSGSHLLHLLTTLLPEVGQKSRQEESLIQQDFLGSCYVSETVLDPGD